MEYMDYITTAKILSAEINKFMNRIIKFSVFTKADVRTSVEAMPYGVDSCPIANIIGVNLPTSHNADTFIIGYVNKNQKAAPGELRTYSTDTIGNEKFYTWLKADGTYEIGGNVDNAVRYAALNAALQEQVNALNIQLATIQTAITALGGTYVRVAVELDLSAAKITQIKTP